MVYIDFSIVYNVENNAYGTKWTLIEAKIIG